MGKNFTYIAPLPVFRNLKRHFVLCNLWQRLFLLDLARLDERLFLRLYLLIQLFAGSFLRALFHKFPLNGKLQEGFLHIRGKPRVETLQTTPRRFVAVNQRQQFLYAGNDSLLLGKGWEGNE